MSDRGKKIFLALSIIIPFMLYCGYYYYDMIRRAPYNFEKFEYLVVKFGKADAMVNVLDTRTGTFQYIDTRNDSLIKLEIELNRDEIQAIHRKLYESTFFIFDENMLTNNPAATRYYIEAAYQKKTKTVLWDNDYIARRRETEKLADIMKVVQTAIERTAQ